jgi:hypothetical protein
VLPMVAFASLLLGRFTCITFHWTLTWTSLVFEPGQVMILGGCDNGKT